MAVPTVNVWLGPVPDGILLAKTYDGSGDSVNLAQTVTLYPNQYLTVTFEGGDAGDTALVSLYGIETLP